MPRVRCYHVHHALSSPVKNNLAFLTIALTAIRIGGYITPCTQTAIASVEQLLVDIFEQHQPHIKTANHGIGSNHWPAPSLTNKTLPLFKTRWASGPQQSLNYPWHQDFVPTLQLASLLLLKDFPIFRFNRLTFAEHRRKPGNPLRNHVRPMAYAKSTEALRKVKAKIAKFGHVVTLMWAYHGYEHNEDMSYGVIYAYKRDVA